VYGRHANARETVDEECPIDRAMEPYEWSKLIAEQCVDYYATRAGARAAIFRLSTTYAPATPGNPGTFVNFFADAVRNGQRVQLKSRGQQVRDFLHVDDLIQAVERFLLGNHHAGNLTTFNLGGGVSNSTTLLGLTEILGELTGRPPIVELHDAPAGGQSRYVTDISKAERILGWSPQRALRDGLQSIL
jgi:nucleoside-diphosphate-sugar epimerase